MKNEITSLEKIKKLHQNLDAMGEQLGMPLYKFRRDLNKNYGINPLADKFKQEHRPVYDALDELPSASTLWNQTGKDPADPLKEDTVAKIAKFCSRAFVFDKPISPEDLMTRDFSSFPPMHKTGQWKRYEGLYRCFYINPDESQPQLNGGLLKLKENNGFLQAFLVTGIWRDRYFDGLEKIIDQCPTDQLAAKCQAYSHQHPDAEMRLVTYQGSAETTIQGYFLLRLPRVPREDHSNTALILLRRFDTSAQSNYSGGIASITLCRGDNITSYAMVIVRERLSLSGDGEFLTHYLNQTDSGPKGIMVSKDLDKVWNRDLFSRIRSQSGR